MGKLRARIIKVTIDTRGSISPLLGGLVFLLLMVSGLAYEIGKTYVITQGVRDAVQNAAISTVTTNYCNSFCGMREGNSGAYTLDASDNWQNCSDIGNMSDNLCGLLGLQNENGELIKRDDDGKQFGINNISVKLINAPFASDNSKLRVEVKYGLNVYIALFGINFPLSIPQSLNAGFSPKF